MRTGNSVLASLVVFGFLLASPATARTAQAGSVPHTETVEEATLESFLTREYDLKPTYVKGTTRYYRLVIVYKVLNPLGQVMSRSEHRGDIKRVVESVQTDGKAYERITWKNVAVRNAPGATGPYGPYKILPWAEGFSYRFSAEDSHEDFPWNYEDFPKTMEGYQALLLTVDAHFEFDYLRSSYHGAIENLKHIGDEIEAPDSHIPFRLTFPPVVTDSWLEKKDVYIKFVGLTQVAGEPCAVIAHRQGPGEFYLDMAMGTPEPVRNELTSSFSGDLIVRLSDGSLIHGDFIEHVRNKLQLPGQTNPTYTQMQADYVIDEISPEEYERGLEAGPS
jgi:hypothetical protein